MRKIQNRDNQTSNGQNHHKFLIGTHNNHPFPQDSERVRARPPAALAMALGDCCYINNLIRHDYSAFFGVLFIISSIADSYSGFSSNSLAFSREVL